MQIHNVEQGTTEWYDLRVGMLTASQFKSIITPKGKKSASLAPLYAVIAEQILGRSVDDFAGNVYTERGKELEPEAASEYEMMYGVTTEVVGFITNHGFGCSPDRLVGEDGLLEIKCPGEQKHTEHLFYKELPDEYRPQVQGQLYITGRKWCDWMSYHPEMPSKVIRIGRDEEYIESMKKFGQDFLKNIEKHRAELIENKVVTEFKKS